MGKSMQQITISLPRGNAIREDKILPQEISKPMYVRT